MDGWHWTPLLAAIQENSPEDVLASYVLSKRAKRLFSLILPAIPTFHSNQMTWRWDSLIGESL